MIKRCYNCEFIRQAKNNLVCKNKLQTDIYLKKYVYYNFSCELFSKTKFNKDLPDIEKLKLGYIKMKKGAWGFPQI